MNVFYPFSLSNLVSLVSIAFGVAHNAAEELKPQEDTVLVQGNDALASKVLCFAKFALAIQKRIFVSNVLMCDLYQ